MTMNATPIPNFDFTDPTDPVADAVECAWCMRLVPRRQAKAYGNNNPTRNPELDVDPTYLCSDCQGEA